MSKSIVLALIASAAALVAVPAHAGNVSWSVGINLPLPQLVLPAPPVFVAAAPVPVYAPEPVYYQREPVYAPETVYYQRQPVYVRPVPVAYPRYYYQQPAWQHHHHDHDRWDGRGWRRD
jgi:hypothetical protein